LFIHLFLVDQSTVAVRTFDDDDFAVDGDSEREKRLETMIANFWRPLAEKKFEKMITNTIVK
jgi:hypothetical protein